MRHPGRGSTRDSVPDMLACSTAIPLRRCTFERSIFCPGRREQPRTKRAAAHKFFYARVLKAAVRAGAALTPLAKRFGIVGSGSWLVGRKEARARVQSAHARASTAVQSPGCFYCTPKHHGSSCNYSAMRSARSIPEGPMPAATMRLFRNTPRGCIPSASTIVRIFRRAPGGASRRYL